MIFLGSMEGGFTLNQRLWIANQPLYAKGSFGIGDLNADGHLDLVFPNSGEAGVVVYLGNGSGQMGAWTEYPTGSGPISVALADFNHDGRLDVVTSNSTARNLSILLGTEAGALGPKSDFTTGLDPRLFSPGDLDSGDLNGDGLADLVVGSNSPTLTPLFGKGDGTFDVGVVPPSSGRVFRLADVNLDGRIDLIRAGSVVSIELGLGDGTFQPPVDLPRSGNPWEFTGIALGDLNGDAIPDIAAVAPGSDYEAFPPPNRQVSVYISAGSASFPHETLVSTAGAPASITMGDLNGDNLRDMAICNVAALVVSLHFGNGNGTFGDVRNSATGTEPWSVQAADLNGDGYADVATANHGSGTVSVLLGGVGGDLAPKLDYPAGTGPFFLAVGRLNQDDRTDVVVLRNTFSGRGAVSTFLGQEGGGFSPTPEVPTDSDPVEAALGDFNEDHAEDLVMAGWGGLNGVISMVHGTEAGLLGPTSTIDGDAVGPALGTIWAGDLNNDGHLDIAYVAPIAGGPSYPVCARLGHGDGTFGERTEVGVPGTPVSIVGGDLNGDGNVDLVAVGYRTAVSLMGHGDGTFTIGSGFAVPPKQIIARLGDLNGDGIADLVTASFYSNLVSVLVGTGDGGFGEAVCLGAGQAPGAVALDDLDGDGRLDIVAANGDDNTVSLLLNRSAGAGPLVAYASRPGQGVLVIGAGQPNVCLDVKPAESAFTVSDVDPATLYLRSPGTGSIASVRGRFQTSLDGGQSAFAVCFAREDLAKLFGKVGQRTVVQPFLEGTLKNGRQFRADLQMTVVPARGRLSAAVAPNPSNPASVLSFATSRPGWVRVDIVDVRGRVVRTVADERSVVQGYHGYSLDGGTRSGERMASGVYYVNIRTQFDGDQNLRFVVLK